VIDSYNLVIAEIKEKITIKRIVNVTDELKLEISKLLDKGTEWDIEQGGKFLANPDNVLFLAFWEDKVVGFLTGYRLQRIDKRKAEVLLYEIAVHEAFQKKGIGSKLMKAVKLWAKEVSADEVWVLTYSSNLAAMAMYTSAGGEEDPPGTRMFTYKIA